MDNLKKYDDFLNEGLTPPPINRILLNFKIDFEKLFEFDEDEQGSELSNVDILSETGDLTVKYNLTVKDVEFILSEKENDSNYSTFLGQILEEMKEEGEDRKPGFYHVKLNNEWTIAQYNKGGDEVWDIIGSDGIFIDKNFSWIDETPINIGPTKF